MPKSKSSRRWLAEHFTDPYVKSAQKEGYRSRAAYKLLEIQKRDRLFQPGMVVVDLGAAPGSWSQVAKRLVGKNGKVFALDILPMSPLDGVEFIEGDFREESVVAALVALLNKAPVDIVISDMAPNLSGITGVDRPRAIYLAELAIDLVKQVLRPNGTFLLKLFQGEGFDEYLRELRTFFKSVVVRKPLASKSKSAEVYLLAKGFKNTI